MKFTLGLLFSLIICVVHGQIVYDFDTIRYSERITGGLDSIDVKTAYYPSTFDGGVNEISVRTFSVNNHVSQLLNPTFQPEIKWSPMHFSALPHLGFSYSIGQQGSQFLRANYTHAITNKLVLDIEYERNSGQGAIRNAGFSNDNVKLQLQRKGIRYAFQLKGAFQSYNNNHPGGLRTDSLIENFGLEFSPVYKNNAVSRNRSAEVRFKNYLNVLKDSSTMLGIVTNHVYKIRNRVYTESDDTLYAIYSAINIDSTETRDQYNLAQISNGAGVYFSSRKFYIDGLLEHTYWDYQNLGLHTDTNEVDLTSRAFLHLKFLKIENDLLFNFLGRFNEFKEKANVKYLYRGLEVNAFLRLESHAPYQLQRRYFSNGASYVTADIKNQGVFQFGANASYGFLSEKIKLSLFADLATVSNPYLFNDTNWINSTGNYNFSSFGLRSAFKFGVFNLNPTIIYSPNSINYIPDFQVYGRIFVKGKLFKAKKLEAMVGVDVSYVSKYESRVYLPTMDTYNWTSSFNNSGNVMNLHAFLSLGISEFRFFVRYENIGYFWSDKTTQTIANYPISPARIRIGLTWDFFN